MLIYDIHSHLGKTSSGDENTPQELVNDLAAYGISRVGISSLSGISMRDQNDLVHRAMEAYPGAVSYTHLDVYKRQAWFSASAE